MLKIKNIDHFVITSSNPQAILIFYQKLGFSITKKTDESELKIGDFKINVQTLGAELTPHAHQATPGSVDVCFHVDETIDEIQKNLMSASIAIELGPLEKKGANGSMVSIYIRDPEDNLIELSSYRD